MIFRYNNKVKAVAKGSGKLYKLYTIGEKVFFVERKMNSLSEVWHARSGHATVGCFFDNQATGTPLIKL